MLLLTSSRILLISMSYNEYLRDLSMMLLLKM